MTLTSSPCELDNMSLFQDLKLKRRKVDSRCSSDGKNSIFPVRALLVRIRIEREQNLFFSLFFFFYLEQESRTYRPRSVLSTHLPRLFFFFLPLPLETHKRLGPNLILITTQQNTFPR